MAEHKKKKDSDDKTRVVAYLPTTAHRELKKLAIDQQTTVSGLVCSALRANHPQAFR